MWGKLKWRWWAALTLMKVNDWIGWIQAQIARLTAWLIMGDSRKDGVDDDSGQRRGR